MYNALRQSNYKQSHYRNTVTIAVNFMTFICKALTETREILGLAEVWSFLWHSSIHHFLFPLSPLITLFLYVFKVFTPSSFFNKSSGSLSSNCISFFYFLIVSVFHLYRYSTFCLPSVFLLHRYSTFCLSSVF